MTFSQPSEPASFWDKSYSKRTTIGGEVGREANGAATCGPSSLCTPFDVAGSSVAAPRGSRLSFFETADVEPFVALPSPRCEVLPVSRWAARRLSLPPSRYGAKVIL